MLRVSPSWIMDANWSIFNLRENKRKYEGGASQKHQFTTNQFASLEIHREINGIMQCCIKYLISNPNQPGNYTSIIFPPMTLLRLVLTHLHHPRHLRWYAFSVGLHIRESCFSHWNEHANHQKWTCRSNNQIKREEKFTEWRWERTKAAPLQVSIGA